MKYLLFIALIIEVIILTKYDKKVFGNYLSPIAILGYPLIFIILLSLLISKQLGFKTISDDLLLINIIGLFIMWCSSLFWSIITPNTLLSKIKNFFETSPPQNNFPLKKTILTISWFVILIMAYSFIKTYLKFHQNINLIGTDEFIYEYSGYGIKGHILVLGIFTSIYIIGMVKKPDIITFITLLLLIICLLIQQVKTWIYVPIISGLILKFYNNRKIKFNLISIIKFVILIIVIFFLSYYFGAIHNKGDITERSIAIFKHMMGYVFAGILGFGEHIKSGLPIGEYPSHLIMPFKNLWNYLVGEEIQSVVSNYHVFIDYKQAFDVNVKTFFGTIYIYGGFWNSIIYVFILSLLLYFLWIISSLTKNYWLIILYAFLTSPLLLGWFDFYYNQLTFIEIPVIILAILLLNKIYTK